MRRTPTLLEVERRYVLNTLHLCGDNRSLAAKVLGLLARALKIKLHQYEEAGFAMPAPLARNDVSGEVDARDSIEGGELPDDEAAMIDVIEELISVVEAMTESARLDDANGGRRTPRKEKS